MAQVNGISDEIAVFLTQYTFNDEVLPAVVNLAFSGERKPEAWHIRIPTRQVGRGFNKAAAVTVMLPLVTWRKLLKSGKAEQWKKAIETGQIHIHGNQQAAEAFANLFSNQIKARL